MIPKGKGLNLSWADPEVEEDKKEVFAKLARDLGIGTEKGLTYRPHSSRKRKRKW